MEAAFWTVAPSEEAKNCSFPSNKRKHFQGAHNLEVVLFNQKTRLYTSSHVAFCQPLMGTLSQEKGKKTHRELQLVSWFTSSSRPVQVQANKIRRDYQCDCLCRSPFHRHTCSILHDAAKWDMGQHGAQVKISGREKTVRDDKEGDLDRMGNDIHIMPG